MYYVVAILYLIILAMKSFCLIDPQALTIRFTLRSLFLFVLLIAVATPFFQFCWRAIVIAGDQQVYESLQATKLPSLRQYREKRRLAEITSSVVDDGKPLPDGFVVLVRKGDTFGFFIPREQCLNGETLKYEWRYRTDGSGLFYPENKFIKAGNSFSRDGKILFGPFDIEWSGNGLGWGFAYYSADNCGDEPVQICTTNRRTAKYLNACSTKWEYKSSNRVTR